MKYKRISRDYWDYALYPENTNVYEIINKFGKDKEFYYSIYSYSENHYKKHINGIKQLCDSYKVRYDENNLLNIVATLRKNCRNKEELKAFSVAGTEDITTNKLVFDFDSEDNLKLAKKDAIELYSRVITKGILPENVQISFSGNKGFSIEIETDTELKRSEFENIVNNLTEGLKTFDKSVKDQQRLFRIPMTRNKKTGMYKIPLTIGELEELDIKVIKDDASEDLVKENNEYYKDLMKSWTKAKFPKALLDLKLKKENVVENKKEVNTSLDLSKRPPWLSPTKFALQEGFFEKGQRNTALMILAATYKANGFPERVAYGMLKAVAEVQSQRTGMSKFPKEEIWNNIIKTVYSPSWRGGTYSEKETDLLKDISSKFNISDNGDNVRTLSDIGTSLSRFVEYAKNFSKNRITFGLPTLDERVVITTGMGIGLLASAGCHARGTKILMYDGSTKKVEDIVVGDLLMGPDSQSRTVLELRRGREEMVKVTPFRSEEFIVNKSHILNLVPSHQRTKTYLPDSLNIKVFEYINGLEKHNSSVMRSLKLHKVGVDFSNSENVPIDPYYLGIWLGDGTSANLNITSMYNEIVNYCKNYIEQIKLNFNKKYPTGKAWTYSVTGYKQKNNLYTMYRNLNLLDNKHIPEIYLKSSRKDRLALLAGLIDSDGTLEYNKKGWMISQKSKKLTDDIVFLSRSLGFHTSVSLRDKKWKYKTVDKVGKYYHIYISGDEKLEEVPVLLPRKKIIKEKKIKNSSHYGFTYELLPEDDYYGFTLNKDHLYLTSDFMVHHNSGKTTIALNFMKNLSIRGEKVLFECLDMAESFAVARMLQGYIRLSFQDILHKLEINEVDDKLDKAMKDLAEDYKNVQISYKSGTTLEDIENDIKNHYRIFGVYPRLVVVDYLEKIRGPFVDNPVANVGYIASRLTDLAREYNLCMLMVLQPQKSAGDAREPLLSMRKVKGSSVIEQDCRIIMTMWRPGYNPEDNRNDKYASIAVVKNNLGESCKLDYIWDGLSGKFREMDDNERFEYNQFMEELVQKKEQQREAIEW